MTGSRTRHDERGAVAVIVAIAATLLFAVSALAVDLGNAEARVRGTQAQADLAAVAGGGKGGADLPATLPGGNCTSGNLAGQPRTTTSSDPSVADVVNYLNSNRPINDSGTVTVTASQLTDCDTTNGEVIHGTINLTTMQVTPNVNQVTVVTPRAFVQFGLAGVLGLRGTNVSSNATAEIKTPMGAALPFYAFTGCDYGQQTIANPTNGQAPSSVNLASGSDAGPEVLTSLSTVPGSNPLDIALNDTTSQLVINGTGLTGVTQVGFFESGTTSPGPSPVVVNASDNPGGFTVNNNNKITLNAPLPSALTSVQDTWYVRVKIGNGPWSAVTVGNGASATLNALPISVGPPLLICPQGSGSGNFGTLQLSNSQQNGQWQTIAQNVATGLEHTLAPYPSPASPWTCTSGLSPAVLWPNSGTNCVDTETGLDSDAATSGFIKGNSLVLPPGQNGGLLTKSLTDSRAGCNGVPSQTTMLGQQIDNDTLSCFFTDPSTTISQVDSSSYSLSGPAFAQNIWYSPRFVAVPLLGTQPSNGGSQKYEITGFRYGFITEQAQSATKSTGYLGTNGITLSSNGNSVQSIQIIFLNTNALPPPPQDVIKGYMNYTGNGIKDLLLVN